MLKASLVFAAVTLLWFRAATANASTIGASNVTFPGEEQLSIFSQTNPDIIYSLMWTPSGVVAFDVSKGQIVWHSLTGPIFRVMVVSPKLVVVVGSTLKAFDAASGALVWNTTIPQNDYAAALSLGAAKFGGKTIQAVFLYSGGIGRVAAYSLATGALIWQNAELIQNTEHFIYGVSSDPTMVHTGAIVSLLTTPLDMWYVDDGKILAHLQIEERYSWVEALTPDFNVIVYSMQTDEFTAYDPITNFTRVWTIPPSIGTSGYDSLTIVPSNPKLAVIQLEDPVNQTSGLMLMNLETKLPIWTNLTANDFKNQSFAVIEGSLLGEDENIYWKAIKWDNPILVFDYRDGHQIATIPLPDESSELLAVTKKSVLVFATSKMIETNSWETFVTTVPLHK